MKKPIRYRGYYIRHEPAPMRGFNYVFWHEDYDGPEDDRHGYAIDVNEAKKLIDEMENENEHQA